MNLSQLMCNLLSFQVILVTLMSSQVSAQGLGLLAEVAAVLGVLPVSQLLLAGAGLISLKLAFLVKLLTLLGVIPERKVPLLTGQPEGEIAESVYKQQPPSTIATSITPLSQPADESITQTSISSSERPFGIPVVTQSSVKPEDASKSPKSPLNPPSSGPTSDASGETPQGPGESDFTVVRVVQVPQASLTNETGQVQMMIDRAEFSLPVLLMWLQDSGAFNSILDSTSQSTDGDLETSESRVKEATGNFILYPVMFTEFQSSDGLRTERGLTPSADQSIKIEFANGTIAPISNVIDEPIEVVGFKFVSYKVEPKSKHVSKDNE